MKRVVAVFSILLVVLLPIAVCACGSTASTTELSNGTASSSGVSVQQSTVTTAMEPTTTTTIALGPTTSQQQSAPLPGYDSWVVYINDDDSYTEGGITYSIALNLTATNPTQDIAGTYTGSATAKTDTAGNFNGQTLNASAIVNSSKLEFTLAEGFDSSGGALAPLTQDELVYSGSGTIVMQAAGSATIGQAGGPFSNASGQAIEVNTQGSAVTLSVVINGHKFTFQGTISGE